ncbi:MAG: hypothetical protein SVS85_03285, partial [Candidatus Nanohaloarchaea archaeon]|nr:hypothetical protein [Candidatus Nanohaloarchaea archaeon]
MFGGDEEDRTEREEEIEDIVEKYDLELAEESGGEEGRVESREYQEYKEAEREHRERNWYERLVKKLSFFRFTFDDIEEEQRNAINLLHYSIEPGQIAPAAIVVSFLALLLAGGSILFIRPPTIFSFAAVISPFILFYYLLKYPWLKARQKVVSSSQDLIMAVLYMVIYMRSSPSLEGAVAFAARHLTGPVATDFKLMMWEVDVRKHTTIQEAMDDYISVWKPYNEGFVEAMNRVRSSLSESDPERRNEILTEAIDRFLDETRDRMDEFASSLKMPVMVFHGLGILLPVLGIILFPMIAAFMGGGGMVYYLVFLYNVLIPAVSYLIMKNLLTSRPISFSSQAGKIGLTGGEVEVEIGGRQYSFTPFLVSVPLFLLLAAWPAMHYYPILFGAASFPPAPSPLVLLQEMMAVLAIGIPVGIHLYLGYESGVEEQVEVREMEKEFPEILFELGNQLDRGEPIEVAVSEVAE